MRYIYLLILLSFFLFQNLSQGGSEECKDFLDQLDFATFISQHNPQYSVSEEFKKLLGGLSSISNQNNQNLNHLTPAERINIFLDYLVQLEKIGSSKRKEAISLFRDYFESKYVIKEENITKDIVDFQIKESNGRLDRAGVITFIIESQKTSLEQWINFVFDTRHQIPIYLRYWILKSIVELGGQDYDGTYFKRSKNTVSPFPVLSEKVLFKSIKEFAGKEKKNDYVSNLGKYHGLGNKFSQIFSENSAEEKKAQEIIHLVSDNLSGEWKVFKSNDIKRMVSAIKDFQLDWCIADETYAKKYLHDDHSEISIYFSKKNGVEFPRVLILSEGYTEAGKVKRKIYQIRGVQDYQGIDPYVLASKEISKYIKEKYRNVENNLALALEHEERLGEILVNIEKEKNQGGFYQPSLDELNFIYEVNGKFHTLSTDEMNLRFHSLLNGRSKMRDLALVYGLEGDVPMYLALDTFNGGQKSFLGNVTIGSQEIDLKAIERKVTLPELVLGNVYIEMKSLPLNITSFVHPKRVIGDYTVYYNQSSSSRVLYESKYPNEITKNVYFMGVIPDKELFDSAAEIRGYISIQDYKSKKFFLKNHPHLKDKVK